MEFSYKNSFNSSLFMAMFENLYGWRCRSPIGWFEVGESSFLGPDLIYTSLEKVHNIRNHLQKANSRKNSFVDHRKRDLEFKEGHKVYL